MLRENLEEMEETIQRSIRAPCTPTVTVIGEVEMVVVDQIIMAVSKVVVVVEMVDSWIVNEIIAKGMIVETKIVITVVIANLGAEIKIRSALIVVYMDILVNFAPRKVNLIMWNPERSKRILLI